MPLLLVPGTLCDERVFGPLRARLPAIETRVMLTTGASTMREAAEQMLAEAPERFAVLGFSLGGMVAMEMALRAPERVCGLAVMSATPHPVPAESHGARLGAVEEAGRLGVGRFVQERLWKGYCGSVEREDLLPLFADMAETMGHEVFAHQTAVALSRVDFRPRLSAVQCPTLVLGGDEDRVCTPAAQKELVAAIPHCTAVMLRGAGHLALLEKTDEVAEAVAAWFATVTEQSARSDQELSD